MPRCPSCHAEIPVAARFCTECGAAATSPPAPPAPSPSPSAAATVVTAAPSTRPDDTLFTPGAVIAGRFRIVACLGKGGMGEVYRADDLTLGHPVALKFLPQSTAQSPRWLERFRNEVRVARQVAHPSVCRVHDLTDLELPGQGPLHFLSMEYIDGEDLASLLRRIGRLPRDKAVQVARQLCAGLAAAHNAGVLHRDLKPANVMIDGRGNAKITDFGIAALSDQIHGADVRSGTPAYMSPEQLAGREVTVRSDIYSLGLVLYELFTGRQAYKNDATATSASASRTATQLSRPSTLIEDMDPGVERVIMRCLSDEPADRPATAFAVAAALPGGDPLRAALEAGETPSPELVAAAGSEGRLPLRVASALLLFIVAGIAGVVFLSQTTLISSYLPKPLSPEVLADRAANALREMGYPDTPADSGSDFLIKFAYVGEIQSADKSADRWEALRAGRPSVLRYWYRTGAEALTPQNIRRVLTPTDPPVDTPGMTLVELNSLGQLFSFRAVPPAAPAAAGDATTGPPAFSWSKAFSLAGLDLSGFTPVEPTRTPPDFADARFAWEGPLPETPGVIAHIEAASFGGRPTWFRHFSPWELTPDAQKARTPGQIVLLFIQGLVFIGVLCAAWLAHRNFRSGRGDRTGAIRLAAGFFVLSMISWALATHFTTDLMGQWNAIMMGVARALLIGTLAWTFYITLEPFVRKRRPELIVSWTRLIAGRWRDPLVGRHALIGVGVGVLGALLLRSVPLLHAAITGRLPQPATFDPRLLSGVVGSASVCIEAIIAAPVNAMLVFFLFIVLCTALRWRPLGLGVFGLLAGLTFIVDPDGSSISLAIGAGLLVGVGFSAWLNTVGLLGFVASILAINLLLIVPLTPDLGAWHARGVVLALLILGVLTYWAFTAATGVGNRGATATRADPI